MAGIYSECSNREIIIIYSGLQDRHVDSANQNIACCWLSCISFPCTTFPLDHCTCRYYLECTHTHTHTHLTALCPGLPGWDGTGKVKPIWILLEQETVSGSGISWAVCKSAPRSRQITTPAPHRSVFYRPDALPAAQPTASKHRRQQHWRQWHQLGRMSTHNVCVWTCCNQTVLMATLVHNASTSATARSRRTFVTSQQDAVSLIVQLAGQAATARRVTITVLRLDLQNILRFVISAID